MLGAVGLAFALLVAGACARASFRYGWARLQELREAMEIVEPEILAPPEYIVRLSDNSQVVPYPRWILHRNPLELPEYDSGHASEEYDEAMRRYGDMKLHSNPSPELLHVAWQGVQDVMKRQYEQMIMERKQEYESRAV